MEEFHTQVRTVHIAAIIASGALFAFRGLMLNVFGATWTRALPLRISSWIIDSALLAAALTLTTIVGQYPFRDAWLTTKVLLLFVYIGLGVIALRPQRSRKVRLLCWVAAMGVFLFIVSVARARHPLGAAAQFLGAS